MQNPFQIGDTLSISHLVSYADVASFKDKVVHEVYATFAIAREAEWAGRQFVLQMKDESEERIGTFAYVDHHAPAFVNEEVVFISKLEEVEGNKVICSFKARVADRLIATGKTGQKILLKAKLNKILERKA